MERQILVPLDGSVLAEAALPHAILLAQASSSTVHLLRTIVPKVVMPSLAWPMPAPVNMERWLEAERAAAQQYLASIATQIRAANLPVSTTVVEGNPAETILRISKETPAIREVVMASHGRRGLGRWLFGSVAEKVFHAAPVPILVVPVHYAEEAEIAQPHPPINLAQRYATIVVPLDGSSFAEHALGAARMLAERCDATLVLLSVIPVPDELGLGETSLAPFWTVTDQQTARQCVADYLQETAQRLMEHGQAAVRTRWVEGPPAELITATAAEEQADLIVMATHGRSGFSRLWLGSIATRVFQRTDLPVLLIRAQEERAHGRSGE